MALNEWRLIPTLKGMIAYQKEINTLYNNYKLRLVILKTNEGDYRVRVDKIRYIETKVIIFKKFKSEKGALQYAKKYMKTN
mgnify:CR=1 FL=1